MSTRVFAALALFLALLASSAAHAAAVDEFYAARGKQRQGFDRYEGRMNAEEARVLERLFDVTDRVMMANMRVILWFRSYGESGLHFEDYLAQHAELQREIEALDAPPRLASMLAGIAAALAGQRGFFSDWARAIEEGRPFESPLDDEYAHHEGLHRSHRALLRVYGELLALYPDEEAPNRRAFYSHLCALDLI